MDKSNKVFLDSFVLGIACGVQKCLEVLSHSEADRRKNSPANASDGYSELQNFLKVIADVLNHFGEKLEDEADIQSSAFRSMLELSITSSDKSLTAAGVAQQMSGVFEELVQTFRQLISNRNEIKLRAPDSSTEAQSSEKTMSETDMSRELCQVLQEMEGILTKIVDGLKSDEKTVHCSSLSGVIAHSSEKTNLTTGNISLATWGDTGCSTDPRPQTLEDGFKDRTGSAIIEHTGNNDEVVEENSGEEKRKNEYEVEDKDHEEMWSNCDEKLTCMDQEIVSEQQTSILLSEGGPEDDIMQNDETETEFFEYDSCGGKHTDNDDDTVQKGNDEEKQNHDEIAEDESHEEIWSDCDDSLSDGNQEAVSERKVVGPVLEGGTSEIGDEDTADESTTPMENESFVPTEYADLTSEVSKEKELLELSAVRIFREHMDRDGLELEIFRTPRIQPTKHLYYTCSLLGLEGVACGRSKRAAKKNALCKMIHLLVKKHEEGHLPKEISPFTNAELWALEEVCLGGDDYLSQLRHLCDLEKLPPPVFELQISKDSVGDKTFVVKCSALGRTAVGTCTRKRSAKRRAAREIIKQYEQETAAAASAEVSAVE